MTSVRVRHLVLLLILGLFALLLLGAPPAMAENAESVKVRIDHFTHSGCVVDGKRLMPAFASDGGAAFFWLPRQRQSCLDTIKRSLHGCERATSFATNTDAEKYPACLSEFAAEAGSCRVHYELESGKCRQGPESQANSEKEQQELFKPFGPNWMVVDNQLCQVYVNDPGESAIWTGDCVDGKASGEGQLVLHSSKGKAVYTGNMKNGKTQGRGTYLSPDGHRYEGDLRNNERHGRGTYTWPAGHRYEGDWRNGKRHGRGTYTWPAGHRYVGEFRNNEETGQAIFSHASGFRYEGMFRKSKPHGYGILTTPDGEVIQGNWNNGCFEDRGGHWAPGGRSVWLNTTREACGF